MVGCIESQAAAESLKNTSMPGALRGRESVSAGTRARLTAFAAGYADQALRAYGIDPPRGDLAKIAAYLDYQRHSQT
jgi:hypothetical protein